MDKCGTFPGSLERNASPHFLTLIDLKQNSFSNPAKCRTLEAQSAYLYHADWSQNAPLICTCLAYCCQLYMSYSPTRWAPGVHYSLPQALPSLLPLPLQWLLSSQCIERVGWIVSESHFWLFMQGQLTLNSWLQVS